VSADSVYSGMNASDVSVTSIDSSVAHINLSRTSGLVTAEGGSTDSFTIVLGTQPSANVTIGLTSDNTSEGTVSPPSVTFTNGNWNVAQTVTVTGAEDTATDGPKTYHVVTAPASSSDANYNTMNAADVTATNNDDDITVYGGTAGDPSTMVWCSPIANCPQPLGVTIKLKGTVNFLISNAGAMHGAASSEAGPPAWFPNTVLLTTTTPQPITPPTTGAHGFYCWYHGTVMSGTITVNP
jgi:hypothetical protein